MQKIAIAIHGGAGTIIRKNMTPEKEAPYNEALKAAVLLGYNVLKKSGSSLDAVETAVAALEDCPLFNAGKGSVFNNKGGHEMDASIMEGSALKAGAVSLVTNIKNPVKLARAIMEKSEHVFMAGSGAEEFARLHQLEFCDDDYLFNEFRFQQWNEVREQEGFHLDHSVEVKKDDKKFGTVGAVALDANGILAAATSTGGMTNKKFGRIGDSPIIGAGTYANHLCAISCTGHGELFIRSVVAYDIACLMQYKGLSLRDACREVVMEKLVRIGGEGGLIAIDREGNIELPFNSEGMYRASVDVNGKVEVLIYKD
ncbi:MAG: isoaspartyl peptidase/L-asparaginase [Chitinophagales bacterium]